VLYTSVLKLAVLPGTVLYTTFLNLLLLNFSETGTFIFSFHDFFLVYTAFIFSFYCNLVSLNLVYNLMIWSKCNWTNKRINWNDWICIVDELRWILFSLYKMNETVMTNNGWRNFWCLRNDDYNLCCWEMFGVRNYLIGYKYWHCYWYGYKYWYCYLDVLL
jgi:hypothetical protein